MSTYLKNKLLDAVFNGASFGVTTVYVSLHTGDPGATGASEVSGGSYARKALSSAAAASGAVTSDAVVSFTGMPDCSSSPVTHFGLWDAASDGNWLWGGSLAASKAPGAGDTVEFPVGDIDASLS